MKKSDDQPPKQEQLYCLLLPTFPSNTWVCPVQEQFNLKVQLNLKKVSHIDHFWSLTYSIFTLDFTATLFLLYIQQFTFPFKLTVPFATVFVINNHNIVILDAFLKDIQVQFKPQTLIKEYVSCVKLSYMFFPIPLGLIGRKPQQWKVNSRWQVTFAYRHKKDWIRLGLTAFYILKYILNANVRIKQNSKLKVL